jgi:hypothetical protein
MAVTEVLAWLLGLLVVDGFVWVRPGHVLFVSWDGASFRRHGPGLRWVGLLPTAQSYLVAESMPAAPEVGAVEERVQLARRAAERLRWPCGALGVILLVLLPVGVSSGRWLVPAPLLAVVAAVAAVAALTMAARALGSLGVTGRARWSALSPLLFFPPALVHAPAVVLRDALRSHDPLSVAACLLPRLDLGRLLAAELRRLDLALEADASPGLERRRRAVVALATDRGLTADELRGRRNADAVAWCPLCGSDYRAGFATCSDCGVPLLVNETVPAPD